MRRRRAVIFEEDVVVMGLMKMFLSLRGYDFFAYREPMACPIYQGDEPCNLINPCADIMLIDFNIPGMEGSELIKAQSGRDCKLMPANKAIISGYSDMLNRSEIHNLGCAIFEKPLDFSRIAVWFDECERRMDLSQPLGIMRKEKRRPCHREILFQIEHASDLKKGVATNVSPSGLCLKITTALWLHQRLRIKSADIDPMRPASVRWINSIGHNSFLAGVHLEGPAK